MKRRVGISIGRKAVAIAGILAGRRFAIEFSSLSERVQNSTLVDSLASAMNALPPQWRNCEIFIAISSGDLACADCFEVPYCSESQIETISNSLAESRCAGYSAEDLSTDLQRISVAKIGSTIQVIAIPHRTLSAIQECIKKVLPVARLKVVTAIPMALSGVLQSPGVHGLVIAGEGILLSNNNILAWRSFPVGAEQPEQALSSRASSFSTDEIQIYAKEIAFPGIRKVPLELAAAVAVTIAEPRTTPNLLRGAKDAPRNTLSRLRGPLTLAGAAMALLLLVAGLYFDKQVRQVATRTATIEVAERNLWVEALPNETYRPTALTTRLKSILTQRNKVTEANKYPSALAFWSEMASVLPNADQVGLSMESLQFGPDGGRLTGKVNKGTSDPLSNASLLESALNNSDSLAARGEFETRDTEIVVRMRLDYRQPSTKIAGGAKPVGASKP